MNFINWSKNDFKKVICFEADSKNVKKCRCTLEKATDKFDIIPKGAYSKEGFLGFDSKGNGASTESEKSDNTIQITTIDKTLASERPTFIKMDIEGSELEALRGAEETIKKYKPKLAISVYHKMEDIVSIPEYILSLNLDYKLYLRHYSLGGYETVLYAI